MINQVFLHFALLLCVQSSGSTSIYIFVDPIGQPVCRSLVHKKNEIEFVHNNIDCSMFQHKQILRELDITSTQQTNIEKSLKQCRDVFLGSIDDQVKMEQEIEDALSSIEDSLTSSQLARAEQLTRYLYLKRNGLHLFLNKYGKEAGLSISLTPKEKSNEIDVLEELLNQTKERWEGLVNKRSEQATEEADKALLSKFQDPLFLDIALHYRTENESMDLDVLDADLVDLLSIRIQLENGPACVWESNLFKDIPKRQSVNELVEWCRVRNVKKSINELEMTNEQLEKISEIRNQYQTKTMKTIGTTSPNSAESSKELDQWFVDQVLDNVLLPHQKAAVDEIMRTRLQLQFGPAGAIYSMGSDESRESRLSKFNTELDKLESELVQLERQADSKILSQVRPEIRRFVVDSIGTRPKYLKPTTALVLSKLTTLKKELVK